ncbi:phthiocerol/phthiodiolone dimycocerosyl transferase family protein [Alkalimarinus coralli]|uniref:phthiocerol/phthiodiolone dimycocerosyl transferase family protein n=1 Tax=Alkalimarinus coralli TaxID=2935863 RepID=UPI00202B54A8|nr:hypothetical protein [Alkalimarinus coralli]
MNTIQRALSIHEASFPIYAELSPGAGNIVACLRLRGSLSYQQAMDGFSKLMSVEPSLRVGIEWLHPEGQPENYYAVEVDSEGVPFEQLTLAEGDDIAQSAAKVRESLLNQPFQRGHLLWRARLLSRDLEHCLVFSINHGLSDGTSVHYLLNRWLEAMDGSQLLDAYDGAIAPSLWSYMPKKISGFFGAFRSLGMLSTFVKAQKLADQGLAFKVGDNVPAEEHRCRSTYRTLEKGHFGHLLSLVKQSNKSIHGLVGAATVSAFLSDSKDAGNLSNIGDDFAMPFVTTVNVRDKIDPPLSNKVAGSFSSGVTGMVKVDQQCIDSAYQEAPWLLGDQIASGVTAALEEDQHWKVLRIYQLAGFKGLKKMFLDSSEKPLATPISFANLGRVDFSCQTLTVTGYEIYAAFHVSGAGMNITASTLNGALTLCFTGPSPAINEEVMNGYADKVVALLKKWAQLGK